MLTFLLTTLHLVGKIIFKTFKLLLKTTAKGTKCLINKMRGAPSSARIVTFGTVTAIFTSVVLLCLAWWVFDDWWTFTYYINHDDPELEEDYIGNDSNTWDWYGVPDSWGGDTTYPGQAGLQGMYGGVAGGSYYNEYLSIMKETCNGQLIQDKFFSNYSGAFPNGRSSWKQIPVWGFMGINVAETGTNTDGIGPCQFLDVKSYNPSTGYTLGLFNTGFIESQNLTQLDNGFSLQGRKPTSNFTGPLQFGRAWFDVFVGGRTWKTNNARFVPSKMNGYGFDEDAVRVGKSYGQADDGQLDAFYYPDITAAACQYAHYNLGSTGTQPLDSNLNGPAVAVAMASMHYYGEGGMVRYRVGGVPDGMTKQSAATAAWNKVTNLFTAARDYSYANMQNVHVNPYTQAAWEGWGATLLILDGAFPHCSTCLTKIQNDGTKEGSAFAAGALLALQAVQGSSKTAADVTNLYKGLNLSKVTSTVSSNEFSHSTYVWALMEEFAQTGGSPVYMRWEARTIRESAVSLMCGPWTYKNVLALCGVEASIQDCYNDIAGDLVARIDVSDFIWSGGTSGPASVDESGFPTGSYYFGTRKFASFLPGSNQIAAQTSVMYWRTLAKSTGIHFGEDFSSPANTAIATVCSGEVRQSGWDDGWGNYVQVTCERLNPKEPKMIFTYAHFNKREVTAGTQVKAGQQVGLSGSTGASTGPHLHVEMWVYNEFNGSTIRSCMSYGSCFQGLYSPATGPRVQKISSGAKTDKDACIVYSGVGEKLGLLSVVNKTDNPNACKKTPLNAVGINFFMNDALNSWGVADKAGTLASLVSGYQSPEAASTPTSTPEQMQKLIDFGRTKIGIPYKLGGNSDTEGYSCSSYTRTCYAQIGMKIGNTASTQRSQTLQVKIKDIRPGDLVFWHNQSISYEIHTGPTNINDGTAHHVGIITQVDALAPESVKLLECAGSSGVAEHTLSWSSKRNLKEGGGGLYWMREDPDGSTYYWTFGRYPANWKN